MKKLISLLATFSLCAPLLAVNAERSRAISPSYMSQRRRFAREDHTIALQLLTLRSTKAVHFSPAVTMRRYRTDKPHRIEDSTIALSDLPSYLREVIFRKSRRS